MGARIKVGRRSKYNATPTVGASGRTYHSKREAKRADELALMLRVGVIQNLREQQEIDLIVNGVKVCAIILDFVYEENGETVHEDCKGCITPDWKLKAKLFTAITGHPIRLS